MNLKDILKAFELPPSVLFGMATISSVILFLPVNLLLILGLNKLPSIWRTVFGVIFVFSSIMWSINVGLKLLDQIRKQFYGVRFKKRFNSNMKTITQPEGAILVALYRSPTYTEFLPMNDGVILRLSHKNMIQLTCSTQLSNMDMLVAYTLTPIALEYIQTHPDFVEEFDEKSL